MVFIRDVYYDVIYREKIIFLELLKNIRGDSNWTRFMILLIKSY